MPNLWQYESFVVQRQGAEGGTPEPADLAQALNTHGKLGYQVIHIKERADGAFIFIVARDTGRPIDEDDELAKDWLSDVVTSDDAHLRSVSTDY